jgi:hypothetical protein
MEKRNHTVAVVGPPPTTLMPPRVRHAGSDVATLTPWSEDLARRIRNEYLEMPGLSLTLRQAQRMWQLHPSECEHLLDGLVESGFLARSTGGTFVRAGSGRSGA